MDKVDRRTRSRVMACVGSAGNRSTEKRLRALLVRYGFRGWSVHPSCVSGNPDFAFRKKHLAIFVDGCFWHDCPRCCRLPKTHVRYWKDKIAANRRRAARVGATLRRTGWHVLRIWEHEVRDRPDRAIGRIAKAIRRHAR